MEEPERLPCPTCRTPADPQARLCLQCGASLLVDVVLRSPVTDGRVRYRVARALVALPGAQPLGVVQAELASSSPAAGRGVTRAYAHAALPVLAESGLLGSIAPHGEPAARGGQSRLAVGLAVGAALVLLAGGWFASQALRRALAPAAPPSGPSARPQAAAASSSRELARRALLSTAALRCSDSGGSGFFVTPELVVTNAHVLCSGDETIEVGLSDGRRLVGRVVRREVDVDLALVRVAGARVEPMPVGDVADLAPGDRVLIVGSPAGLDFTVQEGSIASLQRSSGAVAYLQLDAKVSPGNSGGPVVDSAGRAVGIVSMKVSGEGIEGIGLALPINYIYGRSLAFVGPPSAAAAASAAFRQMVARARQGAEDGIPERRVEAPAAESGPDDRPLLVGGRVDQYDHLVVRVVRITDFPPGFEEISVTVWSSLDAFCTVKGDIVTWTAVEPSVALAGDPRGATELRRLAAGRTLYVGESPLRWDLCDRTKMRSGIQIELEGANPHANRLEVR